MDAQAKSQTIRQYVEAGYALIPLKGKIPTIKEWTEIPLGAFGEKELADCNYGVSLRAEDLVIDIDPRNFNEGDRPVARLVAAIKAPLTSYTVGTGGGGRHVYFKKPSDILICSSLRDYPGIEFKSRGRQVVGPGSIHPETGKFYELLQGDPGHVMQAPPQLLALLQKTAVPFAELGDGTGEYKNDAQTQGRYAAYLQDTAPPSVEGRGGDNNAFRVAVYGRDLGLPPSLTWGLMVEFWNKRCTPPWDAEELKIKVVHAYKYARGNIGSAHPASDFKAHKAAKIEEPPKKPSWVLTRQGTVVKCFQNLLTYLTLPESGLRKIFGYNEFTGRFEFTAPAPWHNGIMPRYAGVGDNDLKMLKGYLATQYGFEQTIHSIEEGVTNVAYHEKFHPVRDYLNGLKWDKEPRLNLWLHNFVGVEDTEYTRACSRKTLCAAVQRVFHPGVKFDHVLLLEGDQDIGKSTVCKILGGKWAADFPIDPHNKDTIQLMQGRWIVELAELEVARRTDGDALKAFITRTEDQARLAYGRLVGEFPRQSIFIGSKNPGPDGAYLKDDTGNRRWWPVRCRPASGQIDFKGLKAARDQLFAEAVARLNGEGEPLYMETKELKMMASEVVSLRHAEHEWTERIATWIQETGINREFLTTRDIYIDAMGGLDKQLDRKSSLAIAKVLRELGWIPGFKRVNGRFSRGYIKDGSYSVDPKEVAELLKDLC